MRVLKRNGTFEMVSFDKVLRRIQCLSEDLTHIDPSIIAQKVVSRIYDGVKTCELDELSASLCLGLSTNDPEYGVLASRIIISNNQKNTPDTFSEAMKILDEHNLLDKKMYQFILEHKEILDQAIDCKRDYNKTYFSFKTLERSYLIRAKNKTIERIQYMLMRVSCGIHYPDLDEILKSYELMSLGFFTHASPTLYNSGTNNQQLLSCFLSASPDSIEGMYKWLGSIAIISKGAGGNGVCFTSIRGNGAYIRGTNGYSNGIIPFCKVVNESTKHVNQGGRRKGSCAIYLEPHHPDIMKFLELRLNHGNEDDRARDLFHAVWLSDLFMERVKHDKSWSLFDPDECPGLDRCYGEDYRKLYQRYENEGRAKETLKAHDIWKSITRSQIESGTPYVLFKDNVNHKNNQSNLGTIRGSNLCAEIVEYHDEKEFACCCLSSICVQKFVKETKEYDFKTIEEVYDFKTLEEVAGQCVRNLNKVIDRNKYPVPETELSNFRHRPLGIGIQGLADTFFKLRIPWERDGKVTEKAMKLNQYIFETIYYGAMKASLELAKKDGAYSSFKGSPLSEGKFQFDLWEKKASNRYDWESLRKEIIKHGVRNSLLVACMPTASTSQIMGSNECIEPLTSNMYVRSTLSGDFVVANEYLIRDLQKLNLWNTKMKDQIIAHDGSVQYLPIPKEYKDLYKTCWELKQKTLIDLSIGRAPFVCQTQSLNLFYEEPTTRILTRALFYAWENGLKTGSYYIRSRPKAQAQKFTVDPELENQVKNILSRKTGEEKVKKTNEGMRIVCQDDVCTSCSG